MLKTSSRHALKTSPRRLQDQQMFAGFMSTLKNLQKRSYQPNPNSAVLEKIIRLKIHFKVIKTLANMF